jgi:hypothetical protein
MPSPIRLFPVSDRYNLYLLLSLINDIEHPVIADSDSHFFGAM